MSDKIEGTVDRHERGYGFLMLDDESKEDLFIPPGQLGGAMTGDRVRAKIKSSRKGENPEARVIEVIERGVTSLVGRVKFSEGKTLVMPVSVNVGKTVRIADQSDNPEVEDGYLVEIEIEEYDPLRGVMVDVLGEPGDPEVERQLILRKYELEAEFPDRVEQAARVLPDSVSPE